jgi:hypothetical protein
MNVYVDDMRRPARVGAIRGRWSHLFADTSDELHEFAAALGLDRAWVQHAGTVREHYDVTDSKRAEALAAGAVPLTYPRGVANLFDTKRRKNTREETDR